MGDFENKVSDKNAKKHGKKLVVVSILIICICFLLANITRCGKSTSEEMYVFENGSNYQVFEYDGRVLLVGYDGIRFLNIDGSENAFVEVHMSAPHIDISKNMILLYDKGNNNLTVYDRTNKRYSYKSDYPIKVAKVNKNGSVVLITDEVAYNSRVTVLDHKGNEEYIWKIGDEYIVDADISPDGKRIVAGTINTNTGEIIQNIVAVNIEKAEETGRAESKGVMPLCVSFTESGNILAVSDNGISSYDNKAYKKWENSFGNSLLDNFTVDEYGNTVVALRGIKNNSVIKTYTKNGSNSGEYVTETQALHLSLNEKNIAVCEKNKVSHLNFSGKCQGSAEVKKEMYDISVINDDKVVVLCEDSIQLLKP